eukprot:CAMPEP_0194299134 /NCGR_PEP_ID=MMETSP0169-20130528/60552_1 /TAXON_ID=218684 /ORGANISM="Corethron pennatum, Strain L29A3" /LENGTH=901 /DNA_ID=CAMNT_0039049201 /DNA_START=91 /DNA_END=2797 /DNA_ORIENTATION=+
MVKAEKKKRRRVIKAARVNAERNKVGKMQTQSIQTVEECPEGEHQMAERLKVESIEAKKNEEEYLDVERSKAQRIEATRLELDLPKDDLITVKQPEAERIKLENLKNNEINMDLLKGIHAEKEKGLENSRIESRQLEAESVKAEWIETGLPETARPEAERPKKKDLQLKLENLKNNRIKMDRLKEIHAEKEKDLENSRIEADSRIEAGQLEAESVKAEWIETGLTETVRSEAERSRLVAKRCGTERVEREQTKAVSESEKKEVGPMEKKQQIVKRLDAEKAHVEQLETQKLDGKKPGVGQVVTGFESAKAKQLETMRIKTERVEADEANLDAEVVLISRGAVVDTDASDCKLGRPVAVTVPGTPFFGKDGLGDNWCTPDDVSAAGPTGTSFLGGKAEMREIVRVEAEQTEADEAVLEDKAVLTSFGPGRGTDAARCKHGRPPAVMFPVTPPFRTAGGGGNGCTSNGVSATSPTKGSLPGGRDFLTHSQTPGKVTDAARCKYGRPPAVMFPVTPPFRTAGGGENGCTSNGVSATSPTKASLPGGRDFLTHSQTPGKVTDAARCKYGRPPAVMFPVTPPFRTDGGGGNGCTSNSVSATSPTKGSLPGGRGFPTHPQTPPLMPIPKLTVSVRELAERFSRINGNGTESTPTAPSPLLRQHSNSSTNFSPLAVAQSLEPESAKYVPAYTTMGRFGVHGFEDFCQSEISGKATGSLLQSEESSPTAQSFNRPRPRGHSISSTQSSSNPSLCTTQTATPLPLSVPQSSKRRSSKYDQVHNSLGRLGVHGLHRFGVHGFEDFCRSGISGKAAGGLPQSDNLLPTAQSFSQLRPRGDSIPSAQSSPSPSLRNIQSAAPSPPSVPQSSKRRSSKYDQVHNSLGRLGVHGLQVGDNAANWGARRRSWTGGS